MSRELLEVCSFLKQKSISISPQNTWLQSCVDYFKSEGEDYNLRDFVYEQWLLADLCDIEAGCLPCNCTSLEKVTLPGKYCVQINYVVNVAESFYKQLQTLRRPDVQGNLDIDCEKEKPTFEKGKKVKRALKLEMTDGVTTIIGFEDQAIPKLVEPIVPGVKALLKGPLEVRKGVVMLKECNIELLGGEVDTLLIPNAVENILARALGVEENPDPYKTTSGLVGNVIIEDDDDDEAFLIAAEAVEKKGSESLGVSISQQSNQLRQGTLNFEAQGRKTPTDRKANCTNVLSTVTHPAQPDIDLDMSGYDFDEDEFELIAAATASVAEQKLTLAPAAKKQTTLNSFVSVSSELPSVQKKPSERQSNCESNSLRHQLQRSYGSENDVRCTESQRSLNAPEISGSYQKCVASPGPSYTEAATLESSWRPTFQKPNLDLPRPPLKPGQVFIDYLADQSSQVANIINSDSLSQETTQVKSQPSLPKPSPEHSVINETFPPKMFPCKKTVEASVIKLPQKLSVRDDKWCLSAIILAKDKELEVSFSPEVLNKIFGVTALEIKAKRNEVRINSEMKEKINEMLKASQQRIRNLKCKMVIHFISFLAKPVVQDIIAE